MNLSEVLKNTTSETVIVISEGNDKDENILFAGGSSMFSISELMSRPVLFEQKLEDIIYIKLGE